MQNAIKSWEMELSHKTRLQDFKTINPEKFKLSVNGKLYIQLQCLNMCSICLFGIIFHEKLGVVYIVFFNMHLLLFFFIHLTAIIKLRRSVDQIFPYIILPNIVFSRHGLLLPPSRSNLALSANLGERSSCVIYEEKYKNCCVDWTPCLVSSKRIRQPSQYFIFFIIQSCRYILLFR